MTTPAPTQPTPVMDQARIASAVTAIVGIIGTALVYTGVTDSAHVGTITALVLKLVTAVCAVVAVVAPYVAGKVAHKQVTPVASPQNDWGQVLKTAEQWLLENYGKHAAAVPPAAAPPEPAPTVFTPSANPYTKLVPPAPTPDVSPTM